MLPMWLEAILTVVTVVEALYVIVGLFFNQKASPLVRFGGWLWGEPC